MTAARRPYRHWPVALALLAAALLAGLGVWQVERRAWKVALIARVDARLAAAPQAPPPPVRWRAIGPDDAYRRLRASGTWLPVAPAYTQAVTDLGPGWWVLSPLRTAQGVILINRGFVPQSRRGTLPVPAGAATVTGLLRISEPEGGFLRSNRPAEDRWYSRDTAAIARARGLGRVAPYFIDADAASSPDWPRGGLTVVRFRNAHLTYALTWFTLAGMMLFLAWRLARPPAPASGREAEPGGGADGR
ncbi:SURF1 family protein [Sphingomonas sp.]|uniref:SURF1 family protein n=1 Tax=Sphingomonas sp. TaxID=28214 RepID=UPI0035C7DCD4